MKKKNDYLNEIFKIRKDLSNNDKKLISKAYNFAREAHKGQRLDGTKHPYFLHPAYAGLLIARWGRNAEEICAGFLHDVYEDCGVSLETIRRLFSHRIAFLVDGMSWERRWNSKEKKYLKDWEHFHKKRLDYIKQDIGILYCLFADNLSNLDDLSPEKYPRLKKQDKEKIKKKRKRWSYIIKIIVPLFKELNLNKLAKHVSDKIKPVTGNMKSDLRKYISKQEVNRLKKILDKNKLIDDLR